MEIWAGSDTPEEKKMWWFNLRTGQVEFDLVSKALDRVGPFETADEAANAPELLRRRSEAWADEDEQEDR